MAASFDFQTEKESRPGFRAGKKTRADHDSGPKEAVPEVPSFWGSYSCFGVPPKDSTELPEGPAGASRTTKAAAQPDVDCLILGPSGAGKTSFLAALSKACAETRDDSPAACHLLADPALRKLGETASANLRRSGRLELPATTCPTSYHLAFGQKGPLGFRPSIRLRLFEVPDSFLEAAASDARAPLPITARVTCLILCVDLAFHENPNWMDRLPGYLEKLLGNRRLSRPSEVDWLLPVDRILVLVTHGDLLVDALSGQRAGSWEQNASSIDPVHLAVHGLQSATMRQLSRPLANRATLAAAMVSALGRSSGGRWSGPVWRPFGIAEAVNYLAKGIAVGSVVLMSSKDLEVAARTQQSWNA